MPESGQPVPNSTQVDAAFQCSPYLLASIAESSMRKGDLRGMNHPQDFLLKVPLASTVSLVGAAGG